jgi:hypothetical protein
MEDNRKNQCSCGSKLFYAEEIGGKWYVCCAGLGCSNKWIAKREGDKKFPKFNELKKEWQ